MKYNLTYYNEWRNKANIDYDSMKYLSTMYPKPLNVMGFLGQQSIEKNLKSYFALTFRQIQKHMS